LLSGLILSLVVSASNPERLELVLPAIGSLLPIECAFWRAAFDQHHNAIM
jgi:hypothetical protein